MRALILALCLSAPAHAQQPCAPRAEVMPLLAANGQSVRWIGTVMDRQVLEVFTAPSGRWVILATTPNGIACIVAAGREYQGFAAPLPGVPG